MAQIFTVTLTGSQEVPPNASTASGIGTVVWDTATDTATYAFTFRGLDSGPALGRPPQTATTADDVTAMHFHNGARGVNAPVAFGQIGPAQDADDLAVVLNADGSWTVRGAWETTDPANASIAAFGRGTGLDPGRLGRAAVLERAHHAVPGGRDPRAAGRGHVERPQHHGGLT